MRLGFNIDHVATLRNARQEGYPDLVQIAQLAINAGAHQITAHLREDRRHIKDYDMFDIKNKIDSDLNMEMALTQEMLDIALKIKPNSVCLVPENRVEITTEGGLEVAKLKEIIKYFATCLKSSYIKVILFVDPNEADVNAAIDLKVDGVEFNTGNYANLNYLKKHNEVKQIEKMAKLIVSHGMSAHAGHGLNYNNVQSIASIPYITELNIGHFLVSNSMINGIEQSIKTMLKKIHL